MANHIRKINHKGDLYYSLDDIIDLIDKVKDIEELKSILVPKKEGLSDFNKKLVQALNFNPKQPDFRFKIPLKYSSYINIVDNLIAKFEPPCSHVVKTEEEDAIMYHLLFENLKHKTDFQILLRENDITFGSLS